MPPRAPRLSIIGAGTVGTTLGTALSAAGHRVVSVVSRTGSHGLALAKQVRCERVSTSVADLAPETEALLIAVPDAAVNEVARAAASVKSLAFRKLFVVHTSGVHGADALAPLRRKGAAVAAFHPVQTFPRQLSASQMRARLRGICYGIDGDALSLRKAEDLAAALDGIQGIDDWVDRMWAAGHYVYATSGTTGKCSFLNQAFDRLGNPFGLVHHPVKGSPFFQRCFHVGNRTFDETGDREAACPSLTVHGNIHLLLSIHAHSGCLYGCRILRMRHIAQADHGAGRQPQWKRIQLLNPVNHGVDF